MMIEINIIYGLTFAVLTLVLSVGLLFSKRESRGEVVFAQYLVSFLGFKLTIKRR